MEPNKNCTCLLTRYLDIDSAHATQLSVQVGRYSDLRGEDTMSSQVWAEA